MFSRRPVSGEAEASIDRGEEAGAARMAGQRMGNFGGFFSFFFFLNCVRARVYISCIGSGWAWAGGIRFGGWRAFGVMRWAWAELTQPVYETFFFFELARIQN